MTWRNRRAAGWPSLRLRVLAIVLRVALGAVFAWAAWVKLDAPWQLFAATIADYKVLPDWAVIPLARTLPSLELALGILLILGVWVRYAALTTAILMAVFLALMVRAFALGMDISCGCFGPSGDPISWRTLLRDGVLLAQAVAVTLLYWRKRRA